MMEAAQEGAYIRLLAYDWANDGVPADAVMARKLSRLPDGIAIEPVLACFKNHPRKKGFVTNQRLSDERKKQAEHRKERSDSGLKGAKTRWLSHSSAMQQPMAKNGSSSSSSSSDKYHPDSRVALHFLNEKAGKHFRETDANLSKISARLKEPEVTIAGVRQMIERQCKVWPAGDRMHEYLRPETLFGKEKFDGYYGQRQGGVITPMNGTPVKRVAASTMTKEQAMAAFAAGEIDQEPT